MKKKKGFTLVELLAVIVILAVILIIAMPKISDVIKNSKESSLETTAKLIASQAEKKYTENQVLDNSSTIKCSDVAKISDADYESCNITFDSKGNAIVTIVGKGKFEGMAVCNANKNNASISSDCSTDAKYFSYEDIDDGLVKTTTMSSFEVAEVNKCIIYFAGNNPTDAVKEKATTLCNGGSITIEEQNFSLKFLLMAGEIPLSDFDTAGLKVEIMDIIIESVEVKDANMCKSYIQSHGESEADATSLCSTEAGLSRLKRNIVRGLIPLMDYDTAGLKVKYRPYTPSIKIIGYNIEGGTDVVIPSQIDGKTVVAIGDNAFFDSNTGLGLGITSVIIPNIVTSIGRSAFEGNKLTNVEIPSSITAIGNYAFANNKLTNVTIPSSVTLIASYAFADNKLTNVEIPSSITEIGDYAFANNLNIVITNNSSIENTEGVWRNIVGASACTGDVAVEGNVITYIYNKKEC